MGLYSYIMFNFVFSTFMWDFDSFGLLPMISPQG